MEICLSSNFPTRRFSIDSPCRKEFENLAIILDTDLYHEISMKLLKGHYTPKLFKRSFLVQNIVIVWMMTTKLYK